MGKIRAIEEPVYLANLSKPISVRGRNWPSKVASI
jgi:hypothetical protein